MLIYWPKLDLPSLPWPFPKFLLQPLLAYDHVHAANLGRPCAIAVVVDGHALRRNWDFA
jgi:hypothetical protein